MKFLHFFIYIFYFLLLISCASGYNLTKPDSQNYISNHSHKGVKLEYRYNLLDKKYKNKELKKGVKLIAVKITNETNNDLVFGKDIKLTHENGKEIIILDNKKVFTTLKQSPASYLFYLLLTPVNLYTYKTTNGVQETTSTTPIGYVLGPGLAAGNMIAAGSANTKFKEELSKYNIIGTTIKKGETAYGLIGINSYSYDAIKVMVSQ